MDIYKYSSVTVDMLLTANMFNLKYSKYQQLSENKNMITGYTFCSRVWKQKVRS